MNAPRFVLHNSVVMAWCFEDEARTYADSVLESFQRAEAVVPAIWPLELGNALLVAERRRRIAPADSARFLDLVGGLPIAVEQEPPDRMLREIMGLARARQLSTYDASYLDLAMRLDLPLASQDAVLLKAAKQCKVPVYRPRPARKS